MAVDITLTDDTLDISFRGMDTVWALSGGITIPFTEIVKARVVDAKEAKARLRWRTGGTSLPGVTNAGRFTVSDEPGTRELWCTYRDPEYLEITTTRERPHRIVVQHPDRAALAAAINERAGGPTPRADRDGDPAS